jgi:DNA invertase Pin-like site-specific DNA recombinase
MFYLEANIPITCLDASVRRTEDNLECVYKGRKPSVDVDKVKELRDSGLGASAIAKEMGIGRASVYRALG